MPKIIESESQSAEWRSFLTEVNQLRDAIAVGDLKRRLTTDNRNDEAAAACSTLNEILDTIIGTYEEAVTSVDNMSVGRIPPPFKDGFPGDFARAKNVCNGFIDVINRRNTQIGRLTEAAALGDLRLRTNVEEFTGSNRRIFEGFNAMFDAWLAPVGEIERVLEALAKMDLTARVEGHYEGDYDRIATLLNTVSSKLAAEVQHISRHTLVMAAASEELTAITNNLAQGAVENSSMATSAATSSEKVSAGLSAVSAGSAQMLSSIREISQSAGRASAAVQSAVSLTDSTTKKISNLDESSAQIRKVVKVIHGIAQQTNLLALNATIEAARAGEAGKGFAVVATEVKELSKGTAKATEDISQRIAAIQSSTRESVAGIAEIATVTNKVSEISQSIAEAVEQQTATTNEMSRHISEAAGTASTIAKEIAGLAEAAHKTSAAATQTDSAIKELNHILGELRSFVAMFTV
ncbi:MAG: methyl-accepting chemotaxis protein [Terracidiphilus sp.]|jgi:methyl-accepting chemotaxis protein